MSAATAKLLHSEQTSVREVGCAMLVAGLALGAGAAAACALGHTRTPLRALACAGGLLSSLVLTISGAGVALAAGNIGLTIGAASQIGPMLVIVSAPQIRTLPSSEVVMDRAAMISINWSFSWKIVR